MNGSIGFGGSLREISDLSEHTDIAVDAILDCESEDIAQIMQSAAEAAAKGAEATVAMQARFGRARNYGERSVGVMDSGAASWSCMIAAFAEALNN